MSDLPLTTGELVAFAVSAAGFVANFAVTHYRVGKAEDEAKKQDVKLTAADLREEALKERVIKLEGKHEGLDEKHDELKANIEKLEKTLDKRLEGIEKLIRDAIEQR